MTNVRIPRFPDLPTDAHLDPEDMGAWMAAIEEWGISLYQQLQPILIDINLSRQKIKSPARLPTATAQELVDNVKYRAKTAGLVWCPDDGGGPVVAYADTTDMLWKRIDNSVPIAP